MFSFVIDFNEVYFDLPFLWSLNLITFLRDLWFLNGLVIIWWCSDPKGQVLPPSILAAFKTNNRSKMFLNILPVAGTLMLLAAQQGRKAS